MMKPMILQGKSGGMWFVGVYSNNFTDKEDDIISKSAHEEYAAWTKANGVKPPIILYHLPSYEGKVHLANLVGLAKGIFTPEEYNDNLYTLYKSTMIAKADHIIPINGFMFVIGKILDSKLPVVKQLIKSDNTYGMSHGFLSVRDSEGIIEKYFSHEFTILPTRLAANGVTVATFKEDTLMGDIKGMLTDEERDLLTEVLGKGASEVEEGVERARDILAGVLDTKALEEEVVEEVVEEAVEEEVVEEKSDKLEAIFKSMSMVLEQLTAKVEELDKKVSLLQVDEDQKIASMISPTWIPNWDTTNKTTDEEAELIAKLKGELPEDLVEADVDNIMKIALSGILGGQ